MPEIVKHTAHIVLVCKNQAKVQYKKIKKYILYKDIIYIHIYIYIIINK